MKAVGGSAAVSVPPASLMETRSTESADAIAARPSADASTATLMDMRRPRATKPS